MKPVQESGRRKTAIARATLTPGSGIVRVNSYLLDTVTPEMYRMKMQEPLLIAGDAAKKVNIQVTVKGGGIMGQAEATRVAISRALIHYDKKLQSHFLKYDRALIVSDVRRKETHKPNCHGKARAKRQKSYR